MTRDEREILVSMGVGAVIAFCSARGQSPNCVLAETAGGALAGPLFLPSLRSRRDARRKRRVAAPLPAVTQNAAGWVAGQSQSTFRDRAALSRYYGRSDVYFWQMLAGMPPVALAGFRLSGGASSPGSLPLNFLSSNAGAKFGTMLTTSAGKSQAPRLVRRARRRTRGAAGVRRRTNPISY